MINSENKLLFKIRLFIVVFLVATALSGITAFPIETELKWGLDNLPHLIPDKIEGFMRYCYEGIHQQNTQYPPLAYGYDWLAFAHLVIAMVFIGPLMNPVKNRWVIEWAMLACIGVIPLALIAGPIREIPFYWRLVDCSFGVFGIIPLYIVRRWILQLEKIQS